MIQILLKFDIPEHYEEIISELFQCGFTDSYTVKGIEVKLPTNTLFHPNLLNILAVEAIVNICVLRLSKRLTKSLDFNIIEVENLTKPTFEFCFST